MTVGSCPFELSHEQINILYRFWMALMSYLSDERALNASGRKEICSLIDEHLEEGKASAEKISFRSCSKLNWLQEELWHQVSADDPDVILIRFLRSRKWDIPAAFLNLIECLIWRKSNNIHSLISSGYAGLNLKSGHEKLILYNQDKADRTVLYLRLKFHDKNADETENVLKHFIYVTELGRRCGSFQATVVFDLNGSGMSSLDLSLAQKIVTTFQENYPEGLGSWIILGAPWFFKGFWSILRRVMDPEVCSKVKFIDCSEDLHRFIQPHALPLEYGGGGVSLNFISDELNSFLRAQTPVGYVSTDIIENCFNERNLFIEQFNKLTQEIANSLSQGFDPSIAQLIEHRASVKAHLMKIMRKIESNTFCPSILHHLGVICPNSGKVDWASCRLYNEI